MTLIGGIPSGCLDGTFLFLGMAGFGGNGLWERSWLMLTQPSLRPDNVPYMRIPWRKTRLYTVIQLAFVIEIAGAEVATFNEYIALTPGRSINKFAKQIHGISEEVLEEKGKPARIVLTEFFKAVDRVLATHGTIVAHNAAFDVAVVNRTAESCDLDRRLASEDVFCTMQNSKKILGLKNVQGRPKNPKNSELFEALVGPVPPDTQLHDALADVRITCKSYRAAKNAGWW